MELTEQGKIVYERTYSRTKPDGTKETWPETVERVVDGNLALGDPRHELPGERDLLRAYMEQFKIIPAGRHLWASGVKGRQYLFNCWVAPWGEDVTEHFSFTFLRLMEGGGVGANYSNRYLSDYPELMSGRLNVHIVCDPEHEDYEKMQHLLSTEYDHEWAGAVEVEDSREGWADALTDLISTYYRVPENRNRVFDVSRVRPEGARLKTFGGRASGPLPFAMMMHEVAEILNNAPGHMTGLDAMAIDHAVAKCVVSGGNRRSARMSIMHWNDVQIHEFITAKAKGEGHWTTNISVEVDSHFFDAVERGSLHANQVLNAIAEGMRTNGEPGFWNHSLSNVGEPNEVIATNPCGEIALREAENCNLGHVNLAAFVDPETGVIDSYGMRTAHRLVTRFLIRATNGDVNDPKSRELLDLQRRIGVGHLGVASYLAMVGIKYSQAPQDYEFEDLLYVMAAVVTKEARDYTHNLRIPMPVKTRTVAPTGTIAKLCGVSEGIHPIFAPYFTRRIRFSTVDPDQVKTLDEYRSRGYNVEADLYADMTEVVSLPTKDSLLVATENLHGEFIAADLVESAGDLSLDEMLEFQEFYQRWWADNAVSYTVNIDAKKYKVKDLAEAIKNYGRGLKGATVFPELSMPQSPYERLTREEYALYEDWATIGDGVDENCVTGCPIK